jgi:4-diphosphocytidyl-2-C-methyl-D-erythritol kinase
MIAAASKGPTPQDPLPLPLRARAPAKINLGLFVGPLRADGRHELVSVMQSISLADELTLRVAPTDDGRAAGAGAGDVHSGPAGSPAGGDRVICPGVPGPPAHNLAAAALAAFRAATRWNAPPLELRIDKRVPVAAGLGGGSGDAAAALRLAAAASGLGEAALLLELARKLGADVPAQVRPGRWLASGAGELLQALPEPRVPFGVLVLPAATGLSTAAVYARADALAAARGTAALEERRAALARALADGAALPPADLLDNDLQDAARALCPEIDAALAQARAAGADVALLSGSGPTVLGLFAGADGAARASAAASALAGERAAAGAPAALAAEPVEEGFGEAVSAPPCADRIFR